MRLFPLSSHLAHRLERHPFMALHVLDKPLKHQDPMTTTNDLRVHCQGKDALTNTIIQKVKVGRPNLIHLIWRA